MENKNKKRIGWAISITIFLIVTISTRMIWYAVVFNTEIWFLMMCVGYFGLSNTIIKGVLKEDKK